MTKKQLIEQIKDGTKVSFTYKGESNIGVVHIDTRAKTPNEKKIFMGEMGRNGWKVTLRIKLKYATNIKIIE